MWAPSSWILAIYPVRNEIGTPNGSPFVMTFELWLGIKSAAGTINFVVLYRRPVFVAMEVSIKHRAHAI